jgi:hypothetical protein
LSLVRHEDGLEIREPGCICRTLERRSHIQIQGRGDAGNRHVTGRHWVLRPVERDEGWGV